MSRPFNRWRILPIMVLISLLLSASGCFQIVGPESVYRNRPETAPVLTKPVAVTPPPPSKIQASSVPISRGLVGSWHLDNYGFDSSGQGNHGTVIGGAAYTDSMPGFGKALRSGVSSYGLRVPDSTSLDISTNLTLEAWVKLDKVPERSPVVSKVAPKTSANAPQNSYQLQVGADGHVGMSVWKDQETTTVLRGDTRLELGQWYHLAGSYQYTGNGRSIMKVFVNDRLDGTLTDAVGPIFVGSGELMIGRLTGTVDEVHVWNTPYADYLLAATLETDINLPGASQNVTAYISPAVPGVKVNFEILAGSPNHGKSASVSINSAGVARWTYADSTSKEGLDKIRVWIDRDWSGDFDASQDASVTVGRYWLETFVTGDGSIVDGNTVTWTFAGRVGLLGRDVVGSFNLVDNIRGVAYRVDSFEHFSVRRPSAGSPSASHNAAVFGASYTNNLDGSTITLQVWMLDAVAPSNADKISVKTGPGGFPGAIWIGMPNPDWNPPASSYVLQVPISTGNIQVHGP